MLKRKNSSQVNILLFGVFILYILITGNTILHHELWGDEIHSWNIAKASTSFPALIQNTRYEGHPPLWYIILWIISKFTGDPFYFQLIHLIITCTVIFLVLFHSPLPLHAKLLLPFGYFFLYEYAVISRNYAIGVLLAMLTCFLLCKNFRGKTPLYYCALLLLSNTHLLALMLAAGLHLYFLLAKYGQTKKITVVVLHILFGAIVLLPAVYFIFPPSDSELNTAFWTNRWSAGNLKSFLQTPLLAFIPLPAWWVYHCWDTLFLLEIQKENVLFKYLNMLIAISLAFLSIYFFKNNKKSRVVFVTNFILSFIVAAFVFPLIKERYAGFIFVAFIIAFWLYSSEMPKGRIKNRLIILLLALQIPGGIIMTVKDIQRPFSNAYRIKTLLNKVPGNEKLATDYWTINAVNAFADTTLYCIDLEKEVKYILWTQDLLARLNKPDRYTAGVKNIFQQEQLSKLYLVLQRSPANISAIDSLFFKTFNVELIESIEGSINKGDDLYLYEITKK